MEEVHIIPLNDSRKHDISLSCHCSPKIDYPSDNCVIVTHYAYDNRHPIDEMVEELSVELNYGNWGIYVEEI